MSRHDFCVATKALPSGLKSIVTKFFSVAIGSVGLGSRQGPLARSVMTEHAPSALDYLHDKVHGKHESVCSVLALCMR